MIVFSSKTLDFLFENRLRDSREWFEAHRSEYDRQVFAPLHDLTVALTPQMLKIDPLFTTEPRVDKTISRIRRDTRYSHDKSLYRDTMWIIFKRGRMHGAELPGFYFEITCRGFNYGCGFYNAGAEYMNRLRAMVLDQDRSFVRAAQAYRAQKIFQNDAPLYKRPHYPQHCASQRDWLERRGISFNAESQEIDLLFSDRLASKLSADFQKIAPIYDFLLEVSVRTAREENPRR